MQGQCGDLRRGLRAPLGGAGSSGSAAPLRGENDRLDRGFLLARRDDFRLVLFRERHHVCDDRQPLFRAARLANAGAGPLAFFGVLVVVRRFLGLAIVTRPSTFSVLFLAILGWIGFFAVRRFRPQFVGAAAQVPSKLVLAAGSLVVLVALACAVPPVLHHVFLKAGWVVSTNNEMNVFLGNNPFTPNYKTWHLGGNVAKALASRATRIISRPFAAGQTRAAPWCTRRSAIIREHPGIFLLRTANRIRAFWGFDHIATATVRGDWPQCGKTIFLLCLVVEAGGYCLAMLLVICGFFLASPAAMAKQDALLLIAAVLAYQLPYTLSFAYSIYHFPVMGFLFPFAGLSLDKAWREGAAFWPSIKGRKWLWIAMGIFLLMQIEYACQVIAYEGT